MTPTPAGLQAYKKKQKSSKSTTPSQQADTRHETNPSLLRLRKKLATGCISSTEKHVLQMLETQSVAQAKAAARAKTAIRQAAQADLEPLTRAQMLAKFKSRAHVAEIGAAKARTSYIPEGPQAEEEDAKGEEGEKPNFKRQRTSQAHSNQDFWDCYFHQNERNVRSKSQPVDKSSESDHEEEDNEEGDDRDQFGCHQPASDSDSDCIDLDSDGEAHASRGGQQQQHPENFYKQPPCMLSPAAAFQQLVTFVQQLPAQITADKAAAHLKMFGSTRVLTKTDLSSAARRIWLAVHPDKNHSQAAQEATTALGNLLDSLKRNGAL